jgi:GGDEF domain-containing protein
VNASADTSTGLLATGRALVARALQVAPGFLIGVGAPIGSAGGWCLLASSDPGGEAILGRALKAAGAIATSEPVQEVGANVWVVALADAAGMLQGRLVLAAGRDRALPAGATRAVLADFAAAAADALAEARAVRATALAERWQDGLRTLPRLAHAAAGADAVYETLGSILEYAIPGCSWVVQLSGGGSTTLRTAAGSPGVGDGAHLRSICRNAVDLDRAHIDLPNRSAIAMPGDAILLAAPLHDRGMRRAGAVAVRAPIDCGIEDAADEAAFVALCDVASLASDLWTTVRTTRAQQHRDPESGSLTEAGLRDEIAAVAENCRATNRTAALLAVHIDLNAVPTTDRLSCAAHAVLTRFVEDGDVATGASLARLRPWEFAVLLPDVSRRDASLVAARLRWSLRTEGGAGHQLTASVGIALIPFHATTPDVALATAAKALDEARVVGDCEVVAQVAAPPSSRVQRSGALLEMLVTQADLIDHIFFDDRPHSEAVAQRARDLAIRMRSPNDLTEYVTLAGKLHEVGRALLSPHLFTTRSPTPDERRLAKTHVVLGARLVANSGFPRAAECIASMHEHWDGSGEPRRLAGAAIPVGSRILAVANTFEVVLNGLGRGDSGHEAAIAAVTAESGRALDPSIVDALLAST